MPYCAAINCQNKSYKGSGKTFHRFPYQNPILAKTWLDNMRRVNWTPSKYTFLCSDHFEEKYFDRTGQVTRLHPDAAPTCFNFTKNLKKDILERYIPTELKDILDELGDTSDVTRMEYMKVNVKQEELLDDEQHAGHSNHNRGGEYALQQNNSAVAPQDLSSNNPNNATIQNQENGTIQLRSNKRKAQMASSSFVNKKKQAVTDKVIHLTNNKTYIEFAVPRKKVILQLHPPSLNDFELRSNTLMELIASLKVRQCLSSNAEELLETFGELPRGLVRAEESISWNAKLVSLYEAEEVKKFSSILYIHSPKAYDLVGTIFKLPDKSYLQDRLVSKDYFPGFTEEGLFLLQNLIKYPTNSICSIMIDSIDIKKCHYKTKSKKLIGHVDFGNWVNDHNSNDVPLASEILMFSVVGIGSNWKLPIGYILNKGFTGEELKNLVEIAIDMVEKSGLNVRALVCDISRSNIKLGELLGCNIYAKSFNELETCFSHPTNEQQRIHLIYNIPQAFKLLENLLEDRGSLRSDIYGIIKWKFINQLLKKGALEKYIEYYKRTDLNSFIHMKKLASSCSPNFSSVFYSALEFANELGLQEFSGSIATANFYADMYRAIDLLNARTPYLTNEKPPLISCFLAEQLESMSIIAQRFFDLQLADGTPLVSGSHWKAVILPAFIMKSVANLASELFDDGSLKYFTTYRINLDHSKMILSSIQKHGKWKNIPSALEFREGYKKFFQNSLKISSRSPVFNDDFDGEDFTIMQGTLYSIDDKLSRINEPLCRSHHLLDYGIDTQRDTQIIIKHISQRLLCAECMSIMLDDQLDDFTKYIEPSSFILNIIHFANKELKNDLSFSPRKVDHKVLTIYHDYFSLKIQGKSFEYEHFKQEPYHVLCLIKVIIRTYVEHHIYTVNHLYQRKSKLLRYRR